MRPAFLMLSLVFAFSMPRVAALAQPPREWVEPETGHRVIQLSGDEGGSSLYFHQNTYTPKGDKLIFDTRAGIAVIDLTQLGKQPVNAEVVVPEARAPPKGCCPTTAPVGLSLT